MWPAACESVCHRQLPEQVTNHRASSLFYVAATHSLFCLSPTIWVLSPQWISLLHVSQALRKVIFCSFFLFKQSKALIKPGVLELFVSVVTRGFCLTSYSTFCIRRTELALNEACTLVIPLQWFNLCLCVLLPEVVQKSMSDFPFNTCKMVKVHSVLWEMGHFGRGGVVGGSLKSNYASHRGLRKAL